jgi:hypothetical protein
MGNAQAILMAMAAWNIFSGAWWLMVPCALACSASICWYGGRMEQAVPSERR